MGRVLVALRNQSSYGVTRTLPPICIGTVLSAWSAGGAQNGLFPQVLEGGRQGTFVPVG